MTHHDISLWIWAAFFVFLAAMLALDLGVLNKKAHAVHLKEAILWCVAWFLLAMGFAGIVGSWLGRESAFEFLTGYLIELSLSVDNVFVFILIFSYFKVPQEYHHRVLFWGIIGAVVMRLGFIVAGVELINRFEWLIYIFGAFLVYSGVKMALPNKKEMDPSKNPLLLWIRRYLPVTEHIEGSHFLERRFGRLYATPLFLVLIVIESSDVVFAVDSIPAILAISKDPFIIFSSNVFAILGLRSLYFALSGVMKHFRFLGMGLAAVLCFIGLKMLISGVYHIPIELSLGVVALLLGISVAASLLFPEKPVEEK